MQKLRTAISLALAVTTAGLALNANAAPEKGALIGEQSEQIIGAKQYSVLPLNYAASSLLLDELSKDYKIGSTMIVNEAEPKAVADIVAKYDVVYLNGDTLNYRDKSVETFLDTAYNLGKAVVIENSHKLSRDTIPSLPQLAKGDVVTIYPATKGGADRVVVFESDASAELTAANVFSAIATSDNPLETTIDSEELGFEQYRKNTVSLAQMDGDKRATLLSDFSKNLHDELTSTQEEVIYLNSISGGAFGYPCDTAEKNARLCSSAFYTWNVYNYDDGEDKINIPNFTSLGMYRTNVNTVIAMSNYGSANKTMTSNSSTNKAWYLMSMQTEMLLSNYGSLAVFSRQPANISANGTYASSEGLSFGVSAGADPSGPNVGGNLSYSQSNTTTMNFTEWGSTTSSSNGRNASWLFKMRNPNPDNGGSFVDEPLFQKPKFKSLPSISVNGLEFSAEALWAGNINESNQVDFDLKFVAQSQKRWFTDRSIFHWKTSSTTRTFTLNRGLWINAGWLKNL